MIPILTIKASFRVFLWPLQFYPSGEEREGGKRRERRSFIVDSSSRTILEPFVSNSKSSRKKSTHVLCTAKSVRSFRLFLFSSSLSTPFYSIFAYTAGRGELEKEREREREREKSNQILK